MSGADYRVVAQVFGVADVSSTADKSVTNIPFSIVAGLIETRYVPIIGIILQVAHHGTGKTVHSVNKLKHFGMIAYYTSKDLGEVLQCIKPLDVYIISLGPEWCSW
jgi:hypothetical protein